MPKLWNETIESHRRTVRNAILDAASMLVVEHGLRSVTMSRVAENAGIGRATLYKYFQDVEAVVLAWHERQITAHLENLVEVRDQASDPGKRLEGVLEAYALISQGRHVHNDTGLSAVLHRDIHVVRAHQRLRVMIRDLLTEGKEAGVIRDDVSPDELASFCLGALGAAGGLPSKAAVRRLVAVTLTGMRSQS